MSNLPSDSTDVEDVQTETDAHLTNPTLAESKGGIVISLGILGFIIGLKSGLKSFGIGPILICGFSALVIAGGFILNVKPKWRLRFSIRTMLIVAILISVGIGGTRLWVLWDTEIHLRAGVGIKNWIELIDGENRFDNGEIATRFNYEQKDTFSIGGVVNDNPSIHGSPNLTGVLYKTKANYFTFNQKVAELREQVTATMERNPDLKFRGYAIKYEVRLESKVTPNAMTIRFEPIEEVDFEDPPTELQQNSNPNQARQWQRFSPKDKSFDAEFPGIPELYPSRNITPKYGEIETQHAFVRRGVFDFEISYNDYPRPLTDSEIRAELKHLDTFSGILDKSEVEVSNVPAIQVVTKKFSMFLVERYFISNNRLYGLHVGSKQDPRKFPKLTDRFFDSFELAKSDATDSSEFAK